MNKHHLSIDTFDALPLTGTLIGDLQSDHAGESGAVEIYRGMLAVSSDPDIRRFARRHVRAELRHLRFFDDWLPKRHHSRLLPLWKAAGWTLGAVAALFGRRCVYRTVGAVERFVEGHYMAQILVMDATPGLESLAAVLCRFCDDEIHHRSDAEDRLHGPGGLVSRVWCRTIFAGSALGVRVARNI